MESTVGQARVCPARVTLVSGRKMNHNYSDILPIRDEPPDGGVSAREGGPMLPDHLPPDWQGGHHLDT